MPPVPMMCKPLSEDYSDIMTNENMDALRLSTFERTPGAVVDVSCYVSRMYELQGPSQLTCSNVGHWKPSVPTCVLRSKLSSGESVDNVLSTLEKQAAGGVYSEVLVGVAVGVALVMAMVVMMLVWRGRRAGWGRPQELFNHKSCEHSSVTSNPKLAMYGQDNISFNQEMSLNISLDHRNNCPQILLRPALLQRTWPGNAHAWSYQSADRLLRDMERSRRENLWHSWRDFADFSTLQLPPTDSVV